MKKRAKKAADPKRRGRMVTFLNQGGGGPTYSALRVQMRVSDMECYALEGAERFIVGKSIILDREQVEKMLTLFDAPTPSNPKWVEE